jgi:hypothetical protein
VVASVAVLLLISMPVASQAPQAEKSFSGTLAKVDPEKKVITVKGPADQPEMTFTYEHTKSLTIAWMAANDGRKNRQKSVKNFLGLTQRHGAALEGAV